jgi:hypothetical protein
MDQIPMNRLYINIIIVLIILTACSSAGQAFVTPVSTTASPQPTATEVKIYPTPSSPGSSVTWDNLRVTLDRLDVTMEYLTDFGSTRIPTEDNKFLWVHILLKNTGQVEMGLPQLENFSVLYATTELKPTYGHRVDYTDYTTLGSLIFPGQELDGWLRFDIPTIAELDDLRFVFIPESAQLGTSYTSPNYPYADDKPTYVWICTP